jgi:CheY-like chemotaxis protein
MNDRATTSRPTILIVDDVPANLGVLLDFLDTAGYQVLVAESGESALLQLTYARPDIILLDVSMPGSTATRRVARSRRTQAGVRRRCSSSRR